MALDIVIGGPQAPAQQVPDDISRKSEVDDLVTYAEEYLAPRHHVPTVIDEVRADEEHEANQKLQADTDHTVNSLSKTAPSKDNYDYQGAVAGGELFKPLEDGSVDFPNANIKPGRVQVAGFDLGTGEKIFNTYQDQEGIVAEQVKRLMQSKTNDLHGGPMGDQQATSRIAAVAQEEGLSFEEYADSLADMGYTKKMLYPSWRAAQQARIEDTFSRDPEQYMALVPSDQANIEESYTEQDLLQSEFFMNDAATYYEYMEGEPWMGTGEDLHAYIVDQMSQLTAPTWGGKVLAQSMNGDEAFNEAFYNILMVYRGTENDWGQFRRSAGYNVADPTNLLGLSGLGLTGTAASKLAVKQGLSKWMTIAAASRATAKVGAVEGAIFATLDDYYAQAVEMRHTGEDYDTQRGGISAGAGMAGGTVLAGTIGGILSEPAQEFYKSMIRQGRENIGPYKPQVAPWKLQRGSIDLSMASDVADLNQHVGNNWGVSPEQMEVSPQALLAQPKNALVETTEKGTVARGGVKPGVQVTRNLQKLALEANGGRVLDMKKDADELSSRMAAEAEAEMAVSGNAAEWYKGTIAKMNQIVARKYPEVGTDVNARTTFNFALANTSNGSKVSDNARLADQAYDEFRRTGKFPEKFPQGGKEAKAMESNFKFYNKAIEEYGMHKLHRILNTDFTINELRAAGLMDSPKGEKADAVLPGSVVMGPKIGGGFFTNIQGRWDFPTFDMWWMRTMGRLTGDLAKARNQAHYDDLRQVALDAPEKAAEYGYRADMSDDEIADWSLKAFSQWAKDRYPDKDHRFHSLVRSISTGQASKDAPTGGQQRQDMRELVSQTLAKLNAKGYNLDEASLQAVLWFPEQRLWDHLGSKQVGKENDYERAFASLYGESGGGRVDAEAGGAGGPAIPEEARRPALDEKSKAQFLRAESLRSLRRGFLSGDAGGPPRTHGSRDSTNDQRVRFLAGNGKTVEADVSAVYTPSKTKIGDNPMSTQAVFKSTGVTDTPIYELTPSAESASLFKKAITRSKKKSKFGSSVYVYDDYSDARLFTSPDGRNGFAIKPDGDIVSVFGSGDGDGIMNSMLTLAVQEGGRKLDAFNTVLPRIYSDHGFKPVAKVKWSDEAAPEDWDKEIYSAFNDGEPDVVMFVYDPAYQGRAKADIEKLKYSEYDDAVAIQEDQVRD